MEKKQQETADKKILKQEIAVYSEKYNVQGKVMDYGVVTKLVFNYDGKDIEIGIHNNPLMNTDYVQTGRQILESYIENLSSKDRKVMLHNWYIEDHLSQRMQICARTWNRDRAYPVAGFHFLSYLQDPRDIRK